MPRGKTSKAKELEAKDKPPKPPARTTRTRATREAAAVPPRRAPARTRKKMENQEQKGSSRKRRQPAGADDKVVEENPVPNAKRPRHDAVVEETDRALEVLPAKKTARVLSNSKDKLNIQNAATTSATVSMEMDVVCHHSHRKLPGQVMMMGQGDTGQLGLGEQVSEKKKPFPVGGVLEGLRVVQVVCGGMHTAALTDDGKVFTWGCNDEGALGRKTDDGEEYIPGQTLDLQDVMVVQLSAGDSHTAALASNGDVYCWGVFRDSLTERLIELFKGNPCLYDTKCADYHNRDLKKKILEEIADEVGTTSEKVTKKIKSLRSQYTREKQKERRKRSLAGVDGGYLSKWMHYDSLNFLEEFVIPRQSSTGHKDSNGPFGLVQANTPSPTPHVVYSSPNNRATKIASGNDHVVLLTANSDIITFGCAEQGQLGRVPEMFSSRGGRKGLQFLLDPQPVRFRKTRNTPTPRFTDVFCGSYHTFAVTEDEVVYSWGLNNYGQLGTADVESRYQPERLPADWIKEVEHTDGVKENRRDLQRRYEGLVISGGQHHTVLCNKGGVYVMGRREYGRLGLGENSTLEPATPTRVPQLDKIVEVSASTVCSFGVSESGAVYSWGMGTNLQLGTGEEDDLWQPHMISAKKLDGRKVIGSSGGGQHTALLVHSPAQKNKK